MKDQITRHSTLSSQSCSQIRFICVLLLGFFVMSHSTVTGQINFDDFDLILNSDSNHSTIDYVLIVHSSHRCGFCRKLRNDFQSVEIPNHLKIIIIEQDTDPEWIVAEAETYKRSEVYIPSPSSSHRATFLPTAFLYDRNGKKVKKFKGYKDDFWQRVIRKAS